MPADTPAPDRVAARALALAAVCCRGLIEQDAAEPGAEALRINVLNWLEAVGIQGEIEPREFELLLTPLGKLDLKGAMDAGWRSEGMIVLGWALNETPLPAIQEQCEPIDCANRLGFLAELQNTCLRNPALRPSDEIESFAKTYLTLHWRLRTGRREIDLPDCVARCNWGPLQLDGLEILHRDLAIYGVALNDLPEEQFRELISITQERHQALNWLLGYERIYSQVTTDT